MTAGAPLTPRPCRDEGCEARILLARRQPRNRWAAFEAADQPPGSDAAVGCWVLVGEQAWRPPDLIEHLHVTREISEEAARVLVAGYPWHRPHHHEKET